MKISPANSLHGTVHLPGDKSISHRAAFLAAMAVGETRIENFSTGEDCQTTVKCLRELGVSISQDGTNLVVKGVGKRGFRKPTKPLDCGNSGTTMRLLSGILAGQNFESVLIGDESLSKRPMERIIDPLELMGAVIHSNYGSAPLSISGKQPLRSIDYTLPVASAQIKSCVLLAGLNADGQTSIIEPVQTRDHTERMLQWFGVEVEIEKVDACSVISVDGTALLTAKDLVVPCDISSAAFFMVVAACLKGSDITLPNIGLNPSRRAIFDVLQSIGTDLEALEGKEVCNERVVSLRIRGGLHGTEKLIPLILRGEIIANLIDEIPILAVLGSQLESGIEIRDAAELRFKETDRIAAITENLKRMGADVVEFEDGFKVERSSLKGAVVHSFGDHRIAMAFAVAGLLAAGETEIIDAECAEISFPGFFDVLASVAQ